MSVQVTYPNLFKNEKHAGLQLEDWLSLSPSEQIIKRLYFILARAEALTHSINSTPDHNLHHVIGHSIRLTEHVNECIELLKNQDIFNCMDLMIDIGKAMQEIKSLPATYNALHSWKVDLIKVYEMRARGGVKGASHKKEAHKENRKLISDAYEYFLSRNESKPSISKIASRVNRTITENNKGKPTEEHKKPLTTRTVRNHVDKIKGK